MQMPSPQAVLIVFLHAVRNAVAICRSAGGILANKRTWNADQGERGRCYLLQSMLRGAMLRSSFGRLKRLAGVLECECELSPAKTTSTKTTRQDGSVCCISHQETLAHLSCGIGIFEAEAGGPHRSLANLVVLCSWERNAHTYAFLGLLHTSCSLLDVLRILVCPNCSTHLRTAQLSLHFVSVLSKESALGASRDPLRSRTFW